MLLFVTALLEMGKYQYKQQDEECCDKHWQTGPKEQHVPVCCIDVHAKGSNDGSGCGISYWNKCSYPVSPAIRVRAFNRSHAC